MATPRMLSALTAVALTATTLLISPTPASAASDPTLAPKDGATVSGSVPVESFPTTRGDKVTSITVDGNPLDAKADVGSSKLRFSVGGNSIEGRFGSYFTINGNKDQRIDLSDPVYVSSTYDVEVPNAWLKEGENTVHLQVGALNASCGLNYDDFEIFDIELVTGGPSEPAKSNKISYSMGDGLCNPNSTSLKEFDVAFILGDDPNATVGMNTELDTTTLSDGKHTLLAKTAQGGKTEHTITVNNGEPGTPDLNVKDGDIAHAQTIFYDIAREGSEPVARYELDGKPVDAIETMGEGTSKFKFHIGKNSSEARYGSTLYFNGISYPLTDRNYADEDVAIEIPNAYLKPGRNKITMVTGTIQSGCGTNHDDFDLTKIDLEFPKGSVTPVDIKDKYAMGDGNCNVNSTKLREATFEFDLDSSTTGLALSLNTAEYPDGEHTVSAVTTGGKRITRTVIFNNNGPKLVSSTPAERSKLTKATELAIELEDVVGVDESATQIILDGTPVKVGDKIGAGLAEGKHTLVVKAKDKLGIESESTVTFTSAAIPGGHVSTKASDDGKPKKQLSATLHDEGDAEYETTFHLAKANQPSAGFEGTSVEIPTELNPKSESKVNLADVANTDDKSDRSPAAKNTSWQRFDVKVGDFAEGSLVQWVGDVDPQRTANLLVWNHKTNAWDEIAAQRGDANHQTALRGSVRADHVKDGVVNAMVAATDPFADDINKSVDRKFQDRDSYDFSIAHFTDTQYLSEGAAGDYRDDNKDLHPEAERKLWRDAYEDTIKWIIDNAEERKIAYAAHTGDIIENNTRKQIDPNMIDQVQREFEIASAIQKRLDDSGIPNGVLAGNHDNRMGTDGAQYNEHFGPKRYEEASKQWREDAQYGGPWKEGDNQNHYDLFSAGGLDFVAVHLSYGVDQEEIDWANEIFQKYPNRNGLLFSHAYLTTSKDADGRDAPYSNAQGREQARKIVDANPNVVMTLSGHHHGVGLNVRNDAGEVGNHVVEMLADYQFYEVPVTHKKLADLRDNYKDDQTLRFGAAFFRLLQFDVKRGELVINAYSPFFNEFGAEQYDKEKRYDGRSDELRVPLQLSSRTTSLATDTFQVITPTEHELGKANAKTNEAATLDVDFSDAKFGLPLEDGVPVAWIAVARNASGGTVASAFDVTFVNLAPAGEQPDEPGPGEDDSDDGISDPGAPKPEQPGDSDDQGSDKPVRPTPGMPKTGYVLTA